MGAKSDKRMAKVCLTLFGGIPKPGQRDGMNWYFGFSRIHTSASFFFLSSGKFTNKRSFAFLVVLYDIYHENNSLQCHKHKELQKLRCSKSNL